MSAANDVLLAARAAGVMVVTAESCTGGLIAAALTEIAGSSDVVWGGYVTYANGAKELMGVDPALIGTFGAVSEEVARAMAEAALARSGVGASVAVTGVAGPGGGSEGKPIGLVHFGVALVGNPTVLHVERYGDLGRAEIRRRTVETALGLLRQALTGS